MADPALIEESERESLPLQGPEIVAARTLFTPAGKESRDIMKTIHSCIKEARKCKTRCAVKMITQLVPMSEYINLCVWYKKHKGLQVAQSQCKHCHCKLDRQRSILCLSDPTPNAVS